ncbi:unnamed protein product [Linum trigynum]|uniref:Uncharacterized protein n=1 Tax=Linum trigynum TaxID=586398 RepID=A0AAV2CYE4_9ROSI
MPSSSLRLVPFHLSETERDETKPPRRAAIIVLAARLPSNPSPPAIIVLAARLPSNPSPRRQTAIKSVAARHHRPRRQTAIKSVASPPDCHQILPLLFCSSSATSG